MHVSNSLFALTTDMYTCVSAPDLKIVGSISTYICRTQRKILTQSRNLLMNTLVTPTVYKLLWIVCE